MGEQVQAQHNGSTSLVNSNPVKVDSSVSTDSEKTIVAGGCSNGSRGRVMKLKLSDASLKAVNLPSDTAEYGGEDDQPHYSRVCKVCNKGFDSGQAFGGHMRIHGKASKPSRRPHRKIDGDHAHAATTLMWGDGESTSLSCRVCHKTFPSDKSLFGHMRSHPQRPRRGLQTLPTSNKKQPTGDPCSIAEYRRNICESGNSYSLPPQPVLSRPPSPSPSSSTSYSSSTSTMSVKKDDSVFYGVSKSEGQISREDDSFVDLSCSLRSWSVTGKRGRKATAITSTEKDSVLKPGIEERLQQALMDFMVSGYELNGRKRIDKRNHEFQEATNSNETVEQKNPDLHSDGNVIFEEASASHDKSTIIVGRTGKRRRNQPSDSSLHTRISDDVEDQEEEDEGHNESNSDGSKQLQPKFSRSRDSQGRPMNNDVLTPSVWSKKKKARKRKLANLGFGADDRHDHAKDQSPLRSRYKCRICNKSFSCHQALGGHRSSHNKYPSNLNFPPRNEISKSQSTQSLSVSSAEHVHCSNKFRTPFMMNDANEDRNQLTAEVVQISSNPAAELEAVLQEHQCSVCSKTFTSSQALGDHQICHLANPSLEAESSHPTSSGETSTKTGGEKVLLDFDLNELPAAINDDREYSI